MKTIRIATFPNDLLRINGLFKNRKKGNGKERPKNPQTTYIKLTSILNCFLSLNMFKISKI